MNIDALRRRWREFWFEPVPATNLCVSRALMFGLMFLFYLTVDFGSFATTPPSLWKPIRLFETLRLPVFSESTLGAMQFAWMAALLLACVGLFTRTAIAVAFVLGVYLLGLPHNWGKVNHSDAVLLMTMGILSVSRCGDAFSLDRVLWYRKALAGDPTPASAEYKWPVRMIWLLGTLLFFGAGMSKLMASGLHWVSSGELGMLLVMHHYSHHPVTTLGLHIAHHAWLAKLMAGATLALEVLLPLALFSRRARWVLVPGMFFAQLGIGLFMGVWFTQFLIYYVFWLPWERLGVVSARLAGRNQPVRATDVFADNGRVAGARL